MALLRCPDCGNGVSSSAKACPACGAPVRKPPMSGKTGCLWIFVLFALVMLAAKLGVDADNSAPARPAAAARPAPPPAVPVRKACAKKDMQCLGEEHESEAAYPCKLAVERLAQYQVEWTDGFMDRPFQVYTAIPDRPGHIGFVGTQVKFQNGFGAWQQMKYVCDYNPATKTATAAAQPLNR